MKDVRFSKTCKLNTEGDYHIGRLLLAQLHINQNVTVSGESDYPPLSENNGISSLHILHFFLQVNDETTIKSNHMMEINILY